MSQWGQAQPQYPVQTGYNPQFQQPFGGGVAPQQTGFPTQRPQGFLQSQPTGFPEVPGFQQQQPTFQQQPQQTGFQQHQLQFQQPQQTGYPGNFAQQARPAPPPVPSLPSQFQQQNVGQGGGFLGAPQQQQPNRFLSTSPAMGGSSLLPQATGFPVVGGLSSGFGGGSSRPLVAQPTGYVDPRLTMMSNTFMPANPSLPYSGGAPQFQQQSGPSLQQNFQQHNQAQRGTATPNVPWTLSKAEKKNYDQIFRAWDASVSGFISGQTALEVFGQSGLDKNELARVWALADTDNRGKLNLAEFHVAMGLIYRRLNGNELPEELPREMVPPSARDLNSSVDIVKEILKNDTRSAGYNSPVSKMRERSFNSTGSPGAGGRQDATVYKHNDTTPPPGGVYQPRSRHVDRATVRVNSDDPAEDLSVMKKQLENTARLLDRTAEENASRTREDEELEREMGDLRYRIKRLQDDLDYVSRGPRSSSKDEERRKLERELVHLMHEKLPSLEKRIEENQTRKDKDKREQMRDRDRRNERFGRFGDRDDERDRYASNRYGDEDGRYSRGAYDRDRSRDRDRDDRDRDYDSRDYDRYDRRDDRDRDYGRPRSPPAAKPSSPPPPSTASTSTVTNPPPASAASPGGNQSKMSREEYRAFIKAEAQRKVQEKLRAYGVHTGSTPTNEFSDVEARLAQEKKEAEEKVQAAERAAEERVRLRQERLANEKALKEGLNPTSPAAPNPPAATSSAPVPPKPTPPKARAPAPPPPRKPPATRPPVVTQRPTPAPVPVVPAPPAAPVPPPEPVADPEEERIRAREAELQEKRQAREARIRELERQEEEAKLAEAEFEKRKLAFVRRSPISTSSTASTPPPVPPPVAVSPAPPPQLEREIVTPALPPPPPVAPPVPTPPPSIKSSTNPFNRLLGDGSTTAPTPAAPSVLAANGSTNPFFRSNTAPPPAAPAPPKSTTPVPVKTNYHTAPSNSDDDWDEVVEREEDDSSEDEFTGSRDKRRGLAEKFFGNILPPARPQSAGPTVGTANSQPSTPVHASPAPPPAPPAPAPPSFGVPDAPPPPGPPPPVSAPASAVAGDRGSLFSSIQSGARLRKAVTNDRSSTSLSGRVLGDIAPPPHINVAPTLASSPPSESRELDLPSPPRMLAEDSLSNRQSVDWYTELAADQGAYRDRDLSLPATAEEDENEPDATHSSLPHIQVESVVDNHDPLEDVDQSVEYRVRSLYPYEGQRSEDLSFGENMILTAHPSKSGGDWWYGTVIRDGNSGFFPQTYVDRFQPIKAKAVYSYAGNNPDEQPFSEGDELTIIDRSEGDWWKSEQAGLVFIVPAAYLEVVEDAQPGFMDSPPTPIDTTEALPRHEERPTTSVEPTNDNSSISDAENDTESEYLSFSGSEDGTNEESEEQHKREREAREMERQRVLEAAGLIVKQDDRRPPPRILRLSRSRRPPPAVPDRLTSVPESPTKELPTLPTETDESDNTIRLDDAFERYETFKLSQFTASANRLSATSFDTVPSPAIPASPSPTSSSFSRVPSIEPSDGRSYSSFLNFLGRSRTPGNDGDRKATLVISAPISGPIVNREPSPLSPENTLVFGTSWASLVDKSALEGIPTSERRRQEAIFELINTESAYVRDLQLIVEIFYSSMIPLLDEKAVTVIFANVEDILLINTTFLSSLEERQKECRLYVDSIGDILRNHIPNMTAYMEYCVNEGTAIKVLQSMRSSNLQLGSHLNRLRDDPSVRNLDLSSYLLVPMQRITRYPLLIRQILQYTEVSEDRANIEQSLRVAESILGHINESIREQEGHERLKTISQDLWVGQGRLDLTAPTRNMGPRRLLKEGIVIKSKSGRKLRAFLCSDVLVLTDENANALYRMPIPLVELQVKEPGARDDLAFHLVLSYPRGGGTIALRATSVRECQLWMQSIESARQKCRRADEMAVKNRSSRR